MLISCLAYSTSLKIEVAYFSEKSICCQRTIHCYILGYRTSDVQAAHYPTYKSQSCKIWGFHGATSQKTTFFKLQSSSLWNFLYLPIIYYLSGPNIILSASSSNSFLKVRDQVSYSYIVVNILQWVDPLLGYDLETNTETTFVAKEQILKKQVYATVAGQRLRRQARYHGTGWAITINDVFYVVRVLML
jgi:hypothetical protein